MQKENRDPAVTLSPSSFHSTIVFFLAPALLRPLPSFLKRQLFIMTDKKNGKYLKSTKTRSTPFFVSARDCK